jgi:Tfp pilus assembly protein PilN
MSFVLLVLNVGLYQQHISRQQERSTAIESIETRRSETLTAIQRLQQELSTLELEKQNRQIEFLNTQIATRTFSWSRLMDRLAEVLPETVQLRRVTPKMSDPKDARILRAGVESEHTVIVGMAGVSRSDNAILELVDALFAHPSFVAPNLVNESRRDENLNQFALTVLYLPDRQPSDRQLEVTR